MYQWKRRGLLMRQMKNEPDMMLDWLATYLPAEQCDALTDAVAPVTDDMKAAALEQARATVELYAGAGAVAAVKAALYAEIVRLKPVEVDTRK